MTRNWKKAVAILLTLALLFSVMPINMTVNAASVTVYHEDFANGNGKATQSGSASLTQVSGKTFDGNADGKALYVSSRKDGWDGVDFKFTDIGLVNSKTYTITVKGYVDSNATIPAGAKVIVQELNTSPEAYGNYIGQAAMTTGAAFTITSNYTVDSTYDRIRIQSSNEGATVPFYIGDILITAEVAAPTVTEKYHETFANGTGVAVKNGNAIIAAVDKDFIGNDDKKALYVSNRAKNWDGVDLNFTDIGLQNGKEYTITVKGFVDSDVVVPSGAQAWIQTISGYSVVAGADFTAGAAFTLSGKYTVDTSKDSIIRFNSNEAGATVPFYIGDILITEPSTVVVPPVVVRDPAIPFTTITFEDQTAGGFVGRAGTETLTVTDEASHTGAYSLKVEGRTGLWNGPSLHVEKNVDQGSEYLITAWVKLIDPESTQIQLSTQVGSNGYNTILAKTITTNDGWVKYEGTHRYNNVSSENLTVYVESPYDAPIESATASFYIDDISFVKTLSVALPIQDLTPIKDVYKDDFLIGNAISEEDLQGIRLDLLKKHNNIATAGNAMKPDALQPTKGNFTFTAADAMISKVQAAGLQMHGHVLVWHSQSPAWLNTTTSAIGVSEPLSREEALLNMKTHIKTVMEHFQNNVISWDVVNEAMEDDLSNPSDWKASLRNSPWKQAIGTDYVEQAYLAAREVLNAHPTWNIKLYYNDYNDDNQSKAQAIYSMVREINDNYAVTHPGKLLIDGIGMQAHYTVSTNPANVKLSLEKFISLGVEVSITELDIKAGSDSQLSEKLANAQGNLYAQLFNIYKAHAANIARVTIWGMDDATSWLSTNNPLLFDKNLQAKPAFYGVIDPNKFIAEHETTAPAGPKQTTAKYGTPIVDGSIDSIWSQVTDEIPVNQYQMAWVGATGTAKALWDDKNLYVLIQVSDSFLDKKSLKAHEQDSMEIFVDENNGKTSYYEGDDGQYRVNFDNEASFNPAKIAEGFVSASKVSGTNYTIEMKIPFKTVTPVNNQKIGFDSQVNDAKDGARISAASWNDTTGNGYQDTSMYGELTLSGKETTSSGTTTPTGSSNSTTNNDINITVTKQADQAEVTVKLPITLSSDGSPSVNITDSVVEAILKNIASIEKKDAKLTVTFNLTSTTPGDAVTMKLPSEALAKILSANEEVSLQIDSDLCTVNFDDKAIEAISKAGTGTTEISVSKIKGVEIAKISPAAAEKIGDRPAFEFTVVKGGTRVSDFNGGKVTTSIPYTLVKTEDPNAVLVYWIDSSNNLIPVISTYKNGAVDFITTHFSKFAIGYNKVNFDDVKPDDFYYAPITYLGAREVIKGTSFEPKRNITRGELIVMLMKAYDIKPLVDAKDNFSDAVGEYAGYYAKAKAIGLSSGVGNNKIGASQLLTREMMFKLMYNMLKIVDKLPAIATPAKDSSTTSNYKDFSNWSVEAITKLAESGMLKGIDNKAIQPKSYINRGEIATVLYYLLSK
jgi:endo-1,4-beta-xylanase